MNLGGPLRDDTKNCCVADYSRLLLTKKHNATYYRYNSNSQFLVKVKYINVN